MCESEEKIAVEGVTSAAEMKTESDELASPPLVLEPDHPMMQRFQKAFKRHLERLMSKLTEEVLEMVHIPHPFDLIISKFLRSCFLTEYRPENEGEGERNDRRGTVYPTARTLSTADDVRQVRGNH